MPLFEIREGDGNQGCFQRGIIEAPNAYDALRKASRTRLINRTRDVVLKRDIDGDDQFAIVASYAAPIYGDACRWCAEARLLPSIQNTLKINEADEISKEDLEAAGEFFDNLQKKEN